MLTELHVEAVGIFQDATIEFGPGLTVVTGETGAGKTLLVESLGALLGRRTDVHIIGPGAENARIDGRFQTGDVECILSRVITPQRSKAYVDLRPATLHALTERAHDRMSMTGQGEIATGFTDHALRVALSRVDAELGPIEADYSDCWTRRRKLEQRIAEQGGDEREIAQMIDLYEYQLRELTVARLDDPEEFNALEPLIEALREHDEVRRGIEIASRALTESAGDSIGSAISSLQRFEFLKDHIDRLSGLQAELDDVVLELRTTGERIADDAAQLDVAMQRQHELKSLMRKYGEDLATVIAYRDQLAERIHSLESSSHEREALVAESTALGVELKVLGEVLSERRRGVGVDLARKIEGHLTALHMETARVEVRVQEAEAHSKGTDRIEMWLAANRGSSLKPLDAVASGGERSRLMLGLQLEVLPEVDTVIFDEIDAGIGGATGQSIGQHLAQLAQTRQVLCVTHLPQVAAFADAHIVIRKQDDGNQVRAELQQLETRSERMSELARMLAGIEGSQNAREHAGELLDRAADRKSA